MLPASGSGFSSVVRRSVQRSVSLKSIAIRCCLSDVDVGSSCVASPPNFSSVIGWRSSVNENNYC